MPGLWPVCSSPTTKERARLQAATATATMAGAELGILCFFESQFQEQCCFLCVSPPPPCLPSPALLPRSALSILLRGSWWDGERLEIWVFITSS